MKILITGMTSRQTNSRRSPLSMASLVAQQLRVVGHDVRVERLTSVMDPIWDYDAVVMGLSSPLSPSARYAVTGLSAMQEASESGSLKAVFVDDPDVRKLWHGAKSVLTSPDRLWSDYYSGRPGVHEAREDGRVRDSVLSMLEWVQAGLDGTVPVWWPAHPWATDTALHSQMLSHGRADQSSIEGLDLTPAVLATDVSRVMVDHGDGWVEETLYSTEPMVFDPSSTRYALPYKSTSTVDDNVRMYQLSYGVVQGTTGNRGFGGWWTPTPALAALAERIFLTTSDDGKEIGGPYYRIPSEVEDLGTDDYRALQGEQRSYLEERSWTMEKLRTTLTGALGA